MTIYYCFLVDFEGKSVSSISYFFLIFDRVVSLICEVKVCLEKEKYSDNLRLLSNTNILSYASCFVSV